MKNQLRKFQFTLVEVLIAMGICVIGVVSVMGLFPVGANATRDANMAFNADQAAEQMLNLTKYLFLDEVINEKVQNGTGHNVFEMITGWDIEDTSTYTSQTKPGANAEPDNWSDFSSNGTFADSGSTSEAYIQMLANSGTVIENSGWQLYRLGFVTKNGVENLEDFACVIRLWVTPVYVDELDASSLILPRIATINVEVSWPADLPYEHRQKAEYSLDIFVSN
jgi:Tfp pilus assembly protein PilV